MTKKALLEAEEMKRKGLLHLAELLSEDVPEDDEDEDSEDDEKEDEDKKDDSGDDVEDKVDKKKEDKKDDEVDESFEKVVAGLELDESVVQKMKDIFAVAVSEKAKALSESALTELNAKVETQLQEAEKKHDVAAEAYISYVVEGWKKEHEVPLMNEAKVKLAESFLTKLHDLFAEHALISESDEKFVELEAQKALTEAAQAELQEAIEQLGESTKQLFALKVKETIKELSEGMTDVQAEKFATLVEELDINEGEQLVSIKERLVAVKETFITESKVDVKEELNITEAILIADKKDIKESVKPQMTDKMAQYAAAIKRSVSAQTR